MEQLQQALGDYIQQKLSFKDLMTAVKQQLEKDANSVDAVRAQLRTLQEQRTLPMPIYAELDLYVQQFQKRQQPPEATAISERFTWRLAEAWEDGWQTEACPNLSSGALIKNSYRLKHKVSEDVSGEYWHAIDTLEDERSGKRLVMLRFLSPKLNQHIQLIDKLRHDFHGYQQIRHLNLLNVYEMGRDGGLVFISFAWFQADTLRDLLNHNPTGIPLHGAQDIIQNLTKTLSFSQKNLSHIYLSPENIFYDPVRKITQVADCGLTPLLLTSAVEKLSKANDNRLAYVDCEQINDINKAHAKHYVYTLACLSYELLSGQHPFNGAPCAQAQEKQYQANILSNLSVKQWQILSQGLAFDSNLRLRSVKKLYDGLYPNKNLFGHLIIMLGIALVLGAGLYLLSETIWYYENIRSGIIAQRGSDVNAFESQDTTAQLKILQDDNSAIKDALTRYYIQHIGEKSLEKLEQYAPEVRDELLHNPAVKKRLLSYYDEQITLALSLDKFEFAEQLAQTLQRNYPETASKQTEISVAHEQRVAAVEADYQTCFNAKIIVNDKTPCLRKNLDILRQINPQSPLLDPAPISALYRKTCQKFMDQEAYAQAQTSLDDWHSLLPEDNDPERERLAWLVSRHLDIQALIEKQNFAKALSLIQEAQTLYPKQKDFDNYQKPLEKLRQQAITHIEQRYQIRFDQEQIVPLAEDEDIFDIRQELAAIDPENPLLSDSKLHDLFFEKVVDTAKNSKNALSEVKILLDAWQQLLTSQTANPLSKERFDHACNRVTLYYLQRAEQEQQAAYLEFALTLKPVPSIEEKLKERLNTLQSTPATNNNAQ